MLSKRQMKKASVVKPRQSYKWEVEAHSQVSNDKKSLPKKEGFSTRDGTWTRTSQGTQDFKSCVSTNSTTRASLTVLSVSSQIYSHGLWDLWFGILNMLRAKFRIKTLLMWCSITQLIRLFSLWTDAKLHIFSFYKKKVRVILKFWNSFFNYWDTFHQFFFSNYQWRSKSNDVSVSWFCQ